MRRQRRREGSAGGAAVASYREPALVARSDVAAGTAVATIAS